MKNQINSGTSPSGLLLSMFDFTKSSIDSIWFVGGFLFEPFGTIGFLFKYDKALWNNVIYGSGFGIWIIGKFLCLMIDVSLKLGYDPLESWVYFWELASFITIIDGLTSSLTLSPFTSLFYSSYSFFFLIHSIYTAATNSKTPEVAPTTIMTVMFIEEDSPCWLYCKREERFFSWLNGYDFMLYF